MGSPTSFIRTTDYATIKASDYPLLLTRTRDHALAWERCLAGGIIIEVRIPTKRIVVGFLASFLVAHETRI